jgi:L-aminopeptidase/D-esterase-like protein
LPSVPRSVSRAPAAPARTRAATSCSASRPATRIDELFYAAIDATEGAIVNALLHAKTMTGRGGRTVYAFRSE